MSWTPISVRRFEFQREMRTRPKAMFDALTKLFEGKNINWKMTLRNQLKNVKI